MKCIRIMKKGVAITLAALMLAGCGGINPDATVVNINSGEDSISLGYANFVAHLRQADYDIYYRSYFGDDYWTQDISGSGATTEDSVKEQLMTELENTYLAASHAPDYDVELTDEDEAAIQKAAADFMNINSEEAIKQVGATQDYIEKYLRNQTIAQRVEGVIKEQTEVSLTAEETEQSTIAYTFFETQEFDEQNIQVNKSDEDIAEMKKHAEAVATGEGDFEAEVEAEGGTYTEYHFTKAEEPEEDPQLDEAVIAAAKKLKNGERSEVIEVEDDAFYVVYMIETDDKEATADKVKELTTEKQAEAFTAIIEEWKEKTEWTVNEKEWAKVQFIELFESSAATDETTDAEAADTATEETTETEQE